MKTNAYEFGDTAGGLPLDEPCRLLDDLLLAS